MGHSFESNSRSGRSSRTPSVALSDHTPEANTDQHLRNDSQASGWSNRSNPSNSEDHSAGLYGLVHNPRLSGSSSSSSGSNHPTQNQSPGHQQPPHHPQPSASSQRTNAQSQNPIVTNYILNDDSQLHPPSQRSNRHRQTSNTTNENTIRSRTPALEEEQARGRHSQPGSSAQHAQLGSSIPHSQPGSSTQHAQLGSSTPHSQPGSSTQHAGPLFPENIPEWVPRYFVNRHCTDHAHPVYIRTRRALINHLKSEHPLQGIHECPFPNCLQVCKLTRSLLKHCRNHTNPGDHKCDICGAGFSLQQAVNNHKRKAHYQVHDI